MAIKPKYDINHVSRIKLKILLLQAESSFFIYSNNMSLGMFRNRRVVGLTIQTILCAVKIFPLRSAANLRTDSSG
jgi:hypothetical protein